MNRIKNNTLPFPWLPYLVFFIFSFIFFGFFSDYVLFYQEKLSLFIFSSDFFIENLHQPGGFLIYLGKFFSTFFYNPLSGSLIVSVIIGLTILVISKIITLLSGKEAKIFPFIIGAALFYLQADYRFLLYNNLGLLLQLSLFYVAIRYLTGSKGWGSVIILPLWYYLTGGFAWFFSIILTIYFLYEKGKNGWLKVPAIWLINLGIMYVSKEFLFFQTGKVLLIFPFSEINTGLQSLLFLSVAALLSLLPLLSGIKFRFPGKIRIPGFVADLAGISLLILLLATIALIKFDKKDKHYFHVEKSFYENKFDEIISYNTIKPPTNLLTIFLNNIALCEKDKLDDILFNFPQSPDGQTLFLKWEMVGEILKRGGYFYYTIGMPNEAHRWAFENMVMKGDSPEGMKMLLKTDLINGNYKVASKYISKLRKTLFYNSEARLYEKFLFDDTALDSDPELGEKRRNRLKTDFFSITDDPYINIERILSVDSLNKKAYAYKLAFMLLRKDYKELETELPRLEHFGFTRLPTHVEEAAVTFAAINNGVMPNTGKIQITRNTMARWEEYLRILQLYGNDPRRAEPALRRQFGNTFWYWAVYR